MTGFVPLARPAAWLLAALLGLASVATPADARSIAVLKSRDLRPYAEAIEGMRAALPDATVTEHDLDGKPDTAEERIAEMRAGDPDLLVAVGTLALRALADVRDLPVVFTMVGQPERHFDQSAENISGVSLDQAPGRRFEELRRILPGAKRIGVLLDPAQSKDDYESAVVEAEKLGLTLVQAQVDSPKDVPTAVRSLDDATDAVWLLPNRKALNARSLEYVVVELSKRKIPIFGDSLKFTKAGAMFALDANYGKIGSQTGDRIAALLAGEERSPRIEAPAGLELTLNLRTAELLGLQVPSDIVDGAAVVIE